jgi:hypothetical protein
MGPAGTVGPPAGGRSAVLTWAANRPAIAVTVRAHNVEAFTARLVLDSGADAAVLFARPAKAVRRADAGRTMMIDSGFGMYKVDGRVDACRPC